MLQNTIHSTEAVKHSISVFKKQVLNNDLPEIKTITTYLDTLLELREVYKHNKTALKNLAYGAFSRQRREIDEYGIEHLGRANLSGESWQRGPVVLSWADTLHHGGVDGHNVVIHEFAHKLDMRNGRANGFPPLHKGMSAQQWSEAFNKAYANLEMHIQEHNPIPIDHYAATSAAEFFAVFTELFFEKPLIIRQYYSEIYALLVMFYRQDPVGSTSVS